jgi:hypothetical protein
MGNDASWVTVVDIWNIWNICIHILYTVEVGSLHTLRLESLELVFHSTNFFLTNYSFGKSVRTSTLCMTHVIFPTIVYRQLVYRWFTVYWLFHLYFTVSQFQWVRSLHTLSWLCLQTAWKIPENYVMALEANWQHLSQLEVYLWMYFKAYLQTQFLFAWHHGKIKMNQPRPQKNNCRPPQVWFILGSNFQTSEGTTFICTNHSMQVLTPWDHAAVIPLRKETRSVS